ncbi:restriction endonuclease subunit S [Candidatus Methanoperedens nitratireducens]|uniref:Type I restriction-modification system specificity subunit n=1 Tax=Candidatus Methanoperedens nitratireducens TaxID=1392998 RepID=A0A284VS23_9EURY|nr:restriction endonuclease subunit S [Candidatus Methanoperedens nitroreducens]SNQ61993.1 Type I restriction-modification system specificity subunit [Candidatus Methanoperedens nitroreducens]
MNFNTRTLGNICDEVGGIIRTGPFGSQLHESDYQDEGVPVIMPKNIIDGKVSTEGIARIGDFDVSRLSQHRLQKGDIVYGRRGDIGRRALITEREDGWLCGTGCLRISLGNSVLDPVFLYYYLGQLQVISWIYNKAIGATLPNLNTDIIRSVPITYPPLPTQRKIAAILSAYDDLIENNTRRIKLLEEMAQALYREWFVKFRFPGHEKVRMVESELGMVPEGWDVKKLGDVVELAYGKALKADDRVEGSFPVYGSGGVVGYHNECLVKGPGIIVGRKGNVGSVYWSDYDFFPIDTVYYVKSIIPLPYIYYNLQSQNFINNDAAVPGLNRNQAYMLPFLLPKKDILLNFENFVKDVFRHTKNLRNKNANLRRTRDLLLPKLISGEMDVENIQVRMKNNGSGGA